MFIFLLSLLAGYWVYVSYRNKPNNRGFIYGAIAFFVSMMVLPLALDQFTLSLNQNATTAAQATSNVAV